MHVHIVLMNTHVPRISLILEHVLSYAPDSLLLHTHMLFLPGTAKDINDNEGFAIDEEAKLSAEDETEDGGPTFLNAGTSSNSQMTKSPCAALTSASAATKAKAGNIPCRSEDEDEDDNKDRDVAGSTSGSGEDDTPLTTQEQEKLPPTRTRTLIPYGEALKSSNDIASAKMNFMQESCYKHGDTPLSNEWTLKSLPKRGKEVMLPGGGKVTILKELGSGTYGSVYLVKRNDEIGPCALKVVTPGKPRTLSKECETQWDLSHNQELRKQLGYEPVPRPIELHDFSNGSLFFMTVVDGKTVLDIVNAHYKENRKKIPEDVVALIAFKMLKLLDLLHRKGNIMVRRMSSHTN